MACRIRADVEERLHEPGGCRRLKACRTCGRWPDRSLGLSPDISRAMTLFGSEAQSVGNYASEVPL